MYNFTENPALLPMYLRALGSLKKPKTTATLPQLEARMPCELEAKLLGQYNQVCGTKANVVPLTFPYALAGSLQLWLWSRPEFPVRIVGAVHVRNQIELRRPLSLGEKFELRVRLGECRQVRLGTEHDIITELVDESGTAVWVSTSTNMAPEQPKEKKAATPFEEPAFNESVTFPVPHGIGLAYGKVCRDINPIHIHALGAKLFGFKTPIAHGMWAMARALSALEKDGALSKSLVVRFRKPIPIGRDVRLHFLREAGVTHFALKNLKGDVTHLEGNLTA